MSRQSCYANALVVTAMAVTIAVAVVPMVATMIIVPLVTTVIPVFTMLFPITWNVFAVVPVVLDKIDPLAAGVVFAAMLVPMLGVARRYA